MLRAGVEAVADPRLGEDVTWRGGLRLDLLAQLADEDAEVFGLFHRLSTPDGGEQGVVCQHLAGVAEEIGNQVILLWREVHLRSLHGDAAIFEIEAEVAYFKDG